jgi:hypothetical protein
MLLVASTEDLMKGEAHPTRRGLVLADCPRTKEQTEQLEALIERTHLPPPIIIEIADRSPGGLTLRTWI